MVWDVTVFLFLMYLVRRAQSLQVMVLVDIPQRCDKLMR